MKHKNLLAGFFLLLMSVLLSLACQTQQPESGKTLPAQTVKAQSPTEAYKMLYAACKAKDTETIKQLMSKSSLGLAEFSAAQQKKPVEKILENGLVAPTLSETITEIRDERIKDNFGAVEVFNKQDNRWEDLPFVLEDGGWKLAVGDLFQDTYKSPGKSRAQVETESSNTMMPRNDAKIPESANGAKTVEVPKENKLKK